MVIRLPVALMPNAVRPERNEKIVDREGRPTEKMTRWMEAIKQSVYGVLASIHTFLDLEDTPNSYAGEGEKLVRVNAAENALEFIEPGDVAAIHAPLVTGELPGPVLVSDGLGQCIMVPIG